MLLWPTYIWENLSHIRGVYPGMMFIGNNLNLNEVSGGMIVDNVVNYPGRRFMVVAVADNGWSLYNSALGGDNGNGRVAFDITGPWF